MARKKQQLINYHTSSKTAMPLSGDVQFGEIVVRHHHEEPQLMIKVSSGTSNTDSYAAWFVPFISSAKVSTEIQAAVSQSQGVTEAAIVALSGKVETLSGAVETKYATSADTVAAINAAKDAAISSGGTYTDSQIQMLSGITSAYVASELTSVKNDIDTAQSDISSISGSLWNLSGKVESDYATKAYSDSGDSFVQEVIIGTDEDESTANTIYGAKKYADEKVGHLSAITSAYVESMLSATTGDVQKLERDVESLSGAVSAFSATVANNYATKEFVGNASGYAYNQAKTDLIGEATDAGTADTIWGAKNYASGLNKTLSGDVVTYVDGKFDEIDTTTDGLTNKIDSLSGTVSGLSGNVVNYIDTRLVTVYKYKGSVTNVAALPANAENGDVYNVEEENGVPGETGYTPAGTNYAWVAPDPEVEGDEGHWDPLGGSVDVSAFATTSALTAVENRVGVLEAATGTLNTNLTTLSGSVSAFSASVYNNYATSADTHNAIEAAKAAAVSGAVAAASAYTDSQIEMLSGVTSAYVESQLNPVISRVDTLETNSATHTEVANASAATFDSAYTAAVASAKNYTDARETAIIGGASSDYNTLKKAEDKIKELSAGTDNEITSLDSRLDGLESSALSWNNMVAGSVTDARFGAVADDAEGKKGGQGSGATVDSNAKMMKDSGEIVLDLSGLIIDCGDF